MLSATGRKYLWILLAALTITGLAIYLAPIGLTLAGNDPVSPVPVARDHDPRSLAAQRGIAGNGNRGVYYDSVGKAESAAGHGLPTPSWVPSDISFQGSVVRESQNTPGGMITSMVWAKNDHDFAPPDVSVEEESDPNGRLIPRDPSTVAGKTDVRKGHDMKNGGMQLIVMSFTGFVPAGGANYEVNGIEAWLYRGNKDEGATKSIMWESKGRTLTLWSDRSDAETLRFAESLSF